MLAWRAARGQRLRLAQASYTPTAMNNDFALITLAEDALPSTGTLGLYQPPPQGSQSVDLTTAGAPGCCAAPTLP